MLHPGALYIELTAVICWHICCDCLLHRNTLLLWECSQIALGSKQCLYDVVHFERERLVSILPCITTKTWHKSPHICSLCVSVCPAITSDAPFDKREKKF